MRRLLGFLVALLFAAPAWATCPALPFTFSPGTTAASGQVNANLAALMACINALNGNQITSGTIQNARLDLTTLLTALSGLPHEANNSTLAAKASTAYTTVVRDGFSAPGDGGAATYTSSNVACTLNAGAGDNGSQVQSADGKCWIATFPAEGADVRQFGAKCDGATDDAAAIQAALNTLGPIMLPPRACRLASGITLAGNTQLSSGAAFPSLNQSGGARLVCDLAVTPCVTLGANDNSTPGLSNIVVTRAAGAIPAGSKGVYVNGAYNVQMENVTSLRAADCFYFKGVHLGAGFSAHLNRLYTGICSGSHIVADSWPELYVVNSRFGGAGTAGGAEGNTGSYVRIIGADPDSVVFDSVQFNLATTSDFATYWLDFNNISLMNGGIFRVINSYVERIAAGGGLIHSDATVTDLLKLQLDNVTAFNPSSSILKLNAATEIDQWQWNNVQFECADFTINQTPFINSFQISNSYINCNASFTGAAASVMQIVNLDMPATNLTVAGGQWTQFDCAKCNIGGTVTNTATGVVLVPGGWKSWTPALSCGVGTITTQSNTGKFRWLDTKTVVFDAQLSTANIGTCGTSLFMSLPTTSANSDTTISGAERTNTGKGVYGLISGTSAFLSYVDNTAPIQNGNTIKVGGVYEVNLP